MHTIEENEHFARLGSIRYLDVKTSLSFEPVFHAVHLVKAKSDYIYKEHRHPAFEIIIPIKGAYKCRLNGSKIEIAPGRFLFIQTGDIHQDIFAPGLEYCAITFDLKASGLLKNEKILFKREAKAELRASDFPDDKLTLSVYKFLSSIDLGEGAFVYYVLNGLFQAFFWKVIAVFPESILTPIFVKNARNEEFKNALLDCFEKNIGKKTHVANMAKEVGMSESSLAHKSKEILGVSPSKAFMNYKMKRALRFMKESRMSVKETSEALGFEDQFHFSKTFKKHFTKSPSSFK